MFENAPVTEELHFGTYSPYYVINGPPVEARYCPFWSYAETWRFQDDVYSLRNLELTLLCIRHSGRSTPWCSQSHWGRLSNLCVWIRRGWRPCLVQSRMWSERASNLFWAVEGSQDCLWGCQVCLLPQHLDRGWQQWRFVPTSSLIDFRIWSVLMKLRRTWSYQKICPKGRLVQKYFASWCLQKCFSGWPRLKARLLWSENYYIIGLLKLGREHLLISWMECGTEWESEWCVERTEIDSKKRCLLRPCCL